MIKLKDAPYVFWVFIFGVAFSQLATSKDLTLSVSFVYSILIVFTLKMYLDYILKRLIVAYLKNNNARRFMIYIILISVPVAVVITSFGFLSFSILLPANIVSIFAEDYISDFFGMLSFVILFSGATFGLELLKHKTETERQKQELKNELLEMEIDHLRTQLSPHFTFNILNNLQFLIRKDKDEALELLSRYSSILRYYVYESKNKRIQLNDEISFLKHYFQLEKGRSGEDLQLDFNWNIPENELMIIPFVLSTFVENAFKHVAVSPKGKYFIAMNIYLDNNLLVINIRNSFNSGVSNIKKRGVGLENAKKRLGLSYPENYCLDITQEVEWFQVELQINLEKA